MLPTLEGSCKFVFRHTTWERKGKKGRLQQICCLVLRANSGGMRLFGEESHPTMPKHKTYHILDSIRTFCVDSCTTVHTASRRAGWLPKYSCCHHQNIPRSALLHTAGHVSSQQLDSFVFIVEAASSQIFINSYKFCPYLHFPSFFYSYTFVTNNQRFAKYFIQKWFTLRPVREMAIRVHLQATVLGAATRE